MGQGIVPYGRAREAIIDAAIRLVARDGLTRLTYRSLAAEARTSVGSVQGNFGSLEQVLREALELCLDQSIGRRRRVERIEDLLNPIIDALREGSEPAIFEVRLLVEARQRPGLQRLAEGYYAAHRQATVGIFRDFGIDSADDLVELSIAVADGIVYEWVILGDMQLERSLRQLEGFRALLAGYGARATT